MPVILGKYDHLCKEKGKQVQIQEGLNSLHFIYISVVEVFHSYIQNHPLSTAFNLYSVHTEQQTTCISFTFVCKLICWTKSMVLFFLSVIERALFLCGKKKKSCPWYMCMTCRDKFSRIWNFALSCSVHWLYPGRAHFGQWWKLSALRHHDKAWEKKVLERCPFGQWV